MICSGGRGFEPHRGQRFFSLSPCGPISFLGLTIRRYYLGYILEHFNLSHLNVYIFLTLEGISLKKLHESLGGGTIGHLPSTFDTIHPIDLIFGTYEFSLYFQLIEITWCLISFHGNHNHINDVTSGHHLGFSNFRIFFIFEWNTENGEKTTFSDWNLQTCKIHCKVVSI